MFWSAGGGNEPGEKESLRARVAALLADRYRIERVLGQGGMGVVFLAHDLKHDRPVAVKVLRPDILAPLLTGRFLHEIKLAGSLAHPHIVPLFDSGAAEGVLYYVMPYLTGETLRERLERDGALPVAEAMRLAREVLGALDYAHRHNVVHRDVKPENILLQDGHALVCDFGVARAISAAGGQSAARRSSGQRTAVGTPDYMSPEQATASASIDGRSDVYSLGCVLYEMLTGRPPFTGESTDDVLGAQVTVQPPLVSQLRSGVPAAVSQSVQRALAKKPDDRHPSAAAFADALEAAGTVPAGRPRWWLAGAAALLVIAGAGVFAWPAVLGAGLDTGRYVVLPFRHRGEAAPQLLSGDLCELLLNQGFRRWRDVRVSDDLAVNDALTRLGRPVNTLGDARAVARRVGAGLLVWGEIAELGDSIQIHAVLYDVRRGAALREQDTRIGTDLTNVTQRFQALADSLLLAGTAGSTGTESLHTGVLGAWLAYDSAHAAIARWDLPAAATALRSALARDSAFGDAALWLAQVRHWQGGPAPQWGALATRALTEPTMLAPRDQWRAEALVALAGGRHQQACERYRQLLAGDSLDFGAWYGLGECHARDRVVERDSLSPSGWRFRGSYHTAAHAYARAFRINPSAHRAFYTRLPALLYLAEPAFLRSGGAEGGSGWFGAFPALAGDTLAFTPYPFAEVTAARSDRIPTTGRAAVAYNRNLQLEITRRWTEAFPESPDAHEGFAAILEADGRAGPRSGSPSALDAVRRARALSTDADQQRRLVLAEVRLLIKTEDFGGARRLADSTLRAPAPRTAAAAEVLAALAALTGRVFRAAALARVAAVDTPRAHTGEPIIAPPAERQAAAALVTFAAMGGPADSVARLGAGLERWVASLRPDRRQAAHSALLDQAAVLGFPDFVSFETHRTLSRGRYLLDLHAAAARLDTAAIRAGLARIHGVRRAGVRPGDVALTGTYQEALLFLLLGDTTAAMRHLDAVLQDLPAVRSDVLPDVPQTASLVRAMALRATLAAQVGDTTVSQWWARNVLTLWGDADAPLAGVVRNMRVIAGGRN